MGVRGEGRKERMMMMMMLYPQSASSHPGAWCGIGAMCPSKTRGEYG
jgi:hypothetical protein